jgi:hypothetical protein
MASARQVLLAIAAAGQSSYSPKFRRAPAKLRIVPHVAG